MSSPFLLIAFGLRATLLHFSKPWKIKSQPDHLNEPDPSGRLPSLGTYI